METPQSRINTMEEFIHTIYMRDVYNVLRPTIAQQEDETWWDETFIPEAVNSNNFDFEDAWIDFDEDNQTNTPEVFVVIEMINKINKWSEEITGSSWDYDNLTYGKIFKNFAYFYVCSRGIEFWLEKKDMYNEYVADMGDESDDDGDAESVEEEYNGSKDFPPNETDDNCPICLEAYTPQKQRDGVRNSDYKVKCPHYCCVSCWVELYDKNVGEKKRCPICRANLTNWLENVLPSYQGEYP